MNFRFVLLALSITPAPTFAQDAALTLKPTSRWHLDYADDYCRLARQFGNEEHATLFYMEQYEPTASMTVMVAGPDLKSESMRQPEIRFGPGGQTMDKDRLIGTAMDKFGSGLTATSMTLLPVEEDPLQTAGERGRWKPNDEEAKVKRPLDPEAAAAITWFEVADRKKTLLRLELGSMSEPVRALNACTDELVTHWGIDLERHKGRTRAVAPATYPGNWIGVNDYPSELLRSGTQGLVMFRLDVDESGRPTGCHIQQSTRPAEFDRIVCEKISRKARFSPALDADGKPMKSYWLSSVRFELPR